ncbi:MAG: bifunctional phosphoribosylaminoimidazolecarboxamide formyltransferase/IMP cyclohydrolase [Bacteroidetes bacterium]|nr:bifunctional phosphoribosylaminoimidazolecarboxamide formyltransferase/IMP cyclohydrolase [Bacteroidota bacterium]MBS1931690.1 bifunctional phosphoribosylaminoimidazolecarboxamide formyltransferase/IMP cyclohydrolase [Bacteroidota bacterium]
MNKRIQSALISVFYKDGLEPIVKLLSELNVTIYSTGGTQQFIEQLGIKVIPVESLTTYPSILGGRVKTLHPSVFGGILGKRNDATHVQEMKQYNIPEIDLVIVDLYPFEETVAATTDEKAIIEKIDIGGPSMIRGAAKNHADVVVIANKKDYAALEIILKEQNGETSLEQRKTFAIKAFDVCTAYDTAISDYFHQASFLTPFNKEEQPLRYGENPHQQAKFFGDLNELFDQLNGKELSYNNLVDVDAAISLIVDAAQPAPPESGEAVFAIIKHTNVCGIAQRNNVKESWDAALAGDPESAFGGVLVSNKAIDLATAQAINEIFFEVLIAPSFDIDALSVLKSKKNRILLRYKDQDAGSQQEIQRSLLNGILIQSIDEGNFSEWKEVGGRKTIDMEKEDLKFANLVCKHLKSNAIALVKNKQLIGKGCGQTSRIDALRQAIEKAKQFNFDLHGAVLASDAFFPFEDCVKLSHEAGITSFIQPGGSVRDKDSIEYCVKNNLAMVMTGMRHFKH